MAFLEEFRRHGFIEGQNFAVEWRVFGQNVDLLPQYAAELVSARVDVIATAGDEATRAAQQATKTVPIVALLDDMFGEGHVQSMARPDGNITGISFLTEALGRVLATGNETETGVIRAVLRGAGLPRTFPRTRTSDRARGIP